MRKKKKTGGVEGGGVSEEKNNNGESERMEPDYPTDKRRGGGATTTKKKKKSVIVSTGETSGSPARAEPSSRLLCRLCAALQRHSELVSLSLSLRPSLCLLQQLVPPVVMITWSMMRRKEGVRLQ